MGNNLYSNLVVKERIYVSNMVILLEANVGIRLFWTAVTVHSPLPYRSTMSELSVLNPLIVAPEIFLKKWAMSSLSCGSST